MSPRPGRGARTAKTGKTATGKAFLSAVNAEDFTGMESPGSRLTTTLGQATFQCLFLHQGKKYLMLSQGKDDYSELGEGRFWRLLLHDIEAGKTFPASEIIAVR